MASLQYDPDLALDHLCTKDKRLAKVIDAAGEFTMRPDARPNIFAYLLRSIIFQQLSGKAAGTIHARLLALFPGKLPTPQQLLDTDADVLRSAGVSRGKALALHSLAEHALAGHVPTLARARKLDDDELVDLLTQIRGVGPWTVHMLLLFQLGRPDVLPISDFGVRKGFQLTYRLDDMPTPTQLREHAAKKWTPYSSVASWYMWRATEL